MTRRHILRNTLLTTVGLGATGAGTIYYSKKIEPAWVEVTYHYLHLPRMTPAFHNYRLVQLSDFHTDDTWMTAERLANVVSMTNALKPDLVVITGDFVTDYLDSSEDTLKELGKLKAPDGVLATLGNHDHPAGAEFIRYCLRTNNIHELKNATHTLKRGNDLLHIVGLDDLWPSNRGTPASIWSHQPLLADLTASLPAEGAAILLVHEPDFADVTAQSGRYGLQLSGHSHGGQVRIPFHGALALPPLCEKYPCGLYQLGTMWQYTNRGLGMVKPQVRLNCRPEIAVFQLLSR
ncbi:metallophosphoesterase [Tengunoibacter tsumagoiensis]|nr:metallophosphoesterase [Tengunoibacter tsumagoiensis]